MRLKSNTYITNHNNFMKQVLKTLLSKYSFQPDLKSPVHFSAIVVTEREPLSLKFIIIALIIINIITSFFQNREKRQFFAFR